MVNFYHLLGIGRHADMQTIGVAYNVLARQHETNSETAVGAQASSKHMIEEAHAILSDPVARRAYDRALTRHRRTRWAKFASSAFVGLFGAAAMTLVLAVFLRIDFGSLQTGSSTRVASVARDFHPDPSPTQQPQSVALAASVSSQTDEPVEQSPAEPANPGSIAVGLGDDEALRRRINRIAPEATGYLQVNAWRQASSLPEAKGDGVAVEPEPMTLPTPKVAQLPSKRSEGTAKPPPETGAGTQPVATVAIISKLEPARGTTANNQLAADGKPSVAGERSAAVRHGTEHGESKLLTPGKYDWVRVSYSDVGLSLLLPKQLFVAEQVSSDKRDRLLVSSDGRAILRVYRRDSKDSRTSLQGYRKELMERRYLGAVVRKNVVLDDGFVLVGRIGQERFFERVYHRCGRRAIHAWMLVYPA
ncbi:MAG: DnaJ domain-containing protein, partial [Hyphomicrobiaceae bacterium]